MKTRIFSRRAMVAVFISHVALLLAASPAVAQYTQQAQYQHFNIYLIAMQQGLLSLQNQQAAAMTQLVNLNAQQIYLTNAIANANPRVRQQYVAQLVEVNRQIALLTANLSGNGSWAVPLTTPALPVHQQANLVQQMANVTWLITNTQMALGQVSMNPEPPQIVGKQPVIGYIHQDGTRVSYYFRTP